MKDVLSLFKFLAPSDSYILVLIHLDSITSYSVQFISVKNDELAIDSFYENISEQELKTKLKPEIPVLLSFQGDKVISKEVKISEDVNSIILNENKEDFFISQNRFFESNYVSIVRKYDVNSAIEIFNNLNVTVLDFTIGPFVSLLLKIHTEDSIIYTSGFQLEFSEEGELLDYSKVEIPGEQLRVGSDKLSICQVPLIATFFNYKNVEQFIEEKDIILKNDVDEYKKHKLFLKLLMFTLFLVLFSLIVSTILRGYYQNEYVKAEQELFYLEKTYNEIISLDKEKSELESLVSNLSGFSDEYYSHYVYYLLENIPLGIHLERLDVNPLRHKLFKEKEVQFFNNQIVISGEVDSSNKLSTWIEDLRQKEWVKSIEIKEISKNNYEVLFFNLQIKF